MLDRSVAAYSLLISRAMVTGAIEVRAPHRLDEVVDVRRGVVPHRAQIEALEDVEHLDHRDAAARRRRHADDLMAAVCATDRRAFLRLIAGQILFRDDAAAAFHLGRDEAGRLARVEAVATVTHDAAECSGEVGLTQCFARFVGRSVPRESRNARGIAFHRPKHAGQRAGKVVG
jgi:hypothetical protein